jgi:transposase InsO family protein
LNHWLRITEKKSDQIAWPPDAGFGEDAFDLRAHGAFSHSDCVRDLPRCMTVTQQQCHAKFGWRKSVERAQHCLVSGASNLARRMQLNGRDQLWIADITYIRLKSEFVYLAVILDAFSRKVVGWALDRSLANRLTITALEQAVAQRQPPPGLVHHSDRGLQYARGEYSAGFPDASVRFRMNDGNGENLERASTRLSGEEDSNAVLFPRPLLLLGDTTKA